MKKRGILFFALVCAWLVGCHDDSASVPPQACGNGQLEESEECDGEQFLHSPQSKCQAGYGFGKILYCKLDSCTIDLERSCVPTCGNGKLDGDEECDGEQFLRNPDAKCDSGYEFGDVMFCNPDTCTIDLARSCVKTCGNGTLNDDEECDGAGNTWSFVKNPTSSCPDKYEFGQVMVCNADTCAIELEQSCVPKCGNGKVDTGEECDGEDFSPRATAGCAQGFEFKEKRTCTSACTIDLEKSCTPKCGNNKPDDGEACDGSWFGAKMCSVTGQTIKDPDGFLCTNNCQTVDSSKACAPGSCGDGNLDTGEACDGQRFSDDAKVCPDGMQPKTAPTWLCDKNCTVNTLEACEPVCGDKKVVGNESCDGTAFAVSAKQCPQDHVVLANRDLFTCKTDCSVDTSNACIFHTATQPTLFISGIEADLESPDDTEVRHLYIEIGNLGAKTVLSDCSLVGIKLKDERTIDTNFVFTYPLANAAETLDSSLTDPTHVITVCHQPVAGWIESQSDAHFKELKNSCDVYIPDTQTALKMTYGNHAMHTANSLWGIGVMCGTAMHDMIKLDGLSTIYNQSESNDNIGGARLCCDKVSCRNHQTEGFEATGDTVFTSSYGGKQYSHQVSAFGTQEYKKADCGSTGYIIH